VSQVLEMDERFGIAYWYMAVFQALEGRVAAAHASAEKAYSLRPCDTTAVGLLAGVVACEGDAARAESLLTQLSLGIHGAAVGWAAYHLARLETDQAAEWIGKAIAQRDSAVPVLLPYVRTSSRWPALAKTMNLPEAARQE
jgi:hypothetical protein